MKYYILIFLCVLCSFCAKPQIPEHLKTINFNKTGAYYLEIPTNEPKKGILIVMPGLFDHPYSIFFETTIVQEAIKNGYAVMIPVLSKDNDKFNLSQTSMILLEQMIKEFIVSNKENGSLKIIMGGFSIGGTRAIKFYDYLSKKDNNVVKISAIFAIDPPLDINRLIESDQKHGSKQLQKVITKEITDTTDFGKQLMLWSAYTPKNDNLLPNFIDSKLKIYSEPDIMWYLKKKMDLYDMNIIDISSYVNALKINDSHNNVELIITSNKGFRKGTQEKHPHSWSILDVPEFLKWIE